MNLEQISQDESRQCRSCAAGFTVDLWEQALRARVAPVIEGSPIEIPAPTLCPDCRLQRRLAFRNQIHLFSRTCSRSGEPMISMWSDDAPFPVFKNSIWWSDCWDALESGSEPDFSRPFFPQLAELRSRVPHFGLSAINTVNSEYCNNVGGSKDGLKNCYLVFNTLGNEDCLYGEGISFSRSCIDCTFSRHSELCYDCVWCQQCYNLQSSDYCEGCSDSYFLLNCLQCRDCFACANLQHRRFCFFNEQLGEMEYRTRLEQFNLRTWSGRRAAYSAAMLFFAAHPRPHQWSRMTENVSGNFISESRDVHDAYFIEKGEQLRYCLNLVEGSHSCLDYSVFGYNAQLMYECVSSGLNSLNCRFCSDCWEGVQDLLYCIMCSNSSNCFGCVGLRRKRFCILNRQYSEASYWQLVERLIRHMRETGEWGEFFPMNLAGLPYNRSMAFRYFPMTEEQARKRALAWHNRPSVSRENAIEADDLPDGLPETDVALTAVSSESGKAFRITTEELRWYRRLGVPLPRAAYDERMESRAKRCGGIKLYRRRCDRSGEALSSIYPENCGFPVWQRDIYMKEFRS